MSEVQAQIDQLERQLSDTKQVVERMNMAQKLFTNREFKKLILEEFCVQESARYAHTSADPSLSPENRADALALAQAAGHLKRWLSVQCRMGEVAARDIEQIDAALVELRTEAGE
jgi:TolA-binding protein